MASDNAFGNVASFNTVSIITDSPERILNLIQNEDIALWNVSYTGGALSFKTVNRDIGAIKDIAAKNGGVFELNEIMGMQKLLMRLKKNKAFAAACTLIVSLIIYMSGFIWRIEIYSLRQTDEDKIYACLYQNGIRQFIRKSQADTDDIELMLLRAFDGFSQVTAEYSGGRLLITVTEREAPIVIYDKNTAVDLVANEDCVINEFDVYNGVALFKEGDSVKAGDIVISGSVDYTYRDTSSVRYVHAMGKALTYKKIIIDDIILQAYDPSGAEACGSRKTYHIFNKTFSVSSDGDADGCMKVESSNNPVELAWFQLPVLYDEIKWYNIENCIKKSEEEIAAEVYRTVESGLDEKSSILSVTYSCEYGEYYTLKVSAQVELAVNVLTERLIGN